jgi:hypothetical protein
MWKDGLPWTLNATQSSVREQGRGAQQSLDQSPRKIGTNVLVSELNISVQLHQKPGLKGF